MTGMFPGSGVPPQDAKNSILDPDTINCDELWYSTSRCQPRFDPAAANAELAELINTINAGEVSYDCAKLDQLQLAINYIAQRGLMSGAVTAAGPLNYTVAFTPPVTRYHDFLQIKVTPNVVNAGPVNLDVNGLGLTDVVRNDGNELREADFPAGVPMILIYYAGKWVVPYFVRSQTPIEYKGTLDYWVRTDGSDLTGDGSANSPTKAFRTINFAFQTAIARYTRSPDMVLNIRLGIPGDYEGCRIGKFPGFVNLIGDKVAPAGYRIHCTVDGCCIFAEGSTLRTEGVNCILDALATLTGAGPFGVFAYQNSFVSFNNGRMEQLVNGHAIASGFFESGGGKLQINEGSVVVDGKGHTIAHGMGSQGTGSFTGCSGAVTPNNLTITWIQCNFVVAAYWAYALAGVGVTNDVISGVPLVTVVDSGCVGSEYNATVNSFVYAGGKVIPGATAGTVGSGGVFQP